MSVQEPQRLMPVAHMPESPSGPSVPVDADAFRSAMSRLGGAVTIITARHGDEMAGLTATAVCSVSAQPPRILVCINRNVRAHALVEHSQALVVNVLSAEHETLARRFAGMVQGVVGADRFESGTWTADARGVPLLADAAASLSCAVVETAVSGTHSMFLCEVAAVHVPARTTSSLFYVNRQFFPIAA